MDRRAAAGLALLLVAGCAARQVPPRAIAMAEPEVAAQGSTAAGLAAPVELSLWGSESHEELARATQDPEPTLATPVKLALPLLRPVIPPPAARLVVRVVASDGEPVAGAEVWIGSSRRRNDRLVPAVKSGPDGRIEVEGLAEGVRRVTARADRHRTCARTVVLVSGREQELELRLARLREIEVRVRGPDGRPVVGARVWDLHNPTNGDRRTDETGVVHVTALAHGPLTLLVDHGRVWERCPLGPIETLREPVGVAITGIGPRLVGRIIGPLGPGLSIEARRPESLFPDGQGGFRRPGSIDERGRFVIESIDAGTYDLVVMRDELKLATVPGVTVKRATVQVDLFLPEPARLSGAVVDRDGVPIANAFLVLEQVSGGRLDTLTGPGGAFRFEGLGPGAYWLRSRSHAHGVASARFELQEGDVVDDLRLVLRAPAELRGRLLDPDGALLARAGLRLTDGDRCVLMETSTDEEGGFTFASRLGRPLSGGSYRVELAEETVALLAARLGVGPHVLRVAPVEIEVAAGSTADLTVRIGR